MDLEAIYENVEHRDIQNTTGPQTQSHDQEEGKDLKHRGSRCLVLITVSLGLICVILLVFIILQQNNFNSLSQKKLELETRVKDLSAEKTQLQRDFDPLNQKKLELERRVTSLSEELKKEASKRGWFFMSNESKSWSDSRQYCRNHGADLVIINTEEKQRFISSLVSERVWIGLSDTEQEGNMTWVDNSPLKQEFWLKGEPNDGRGNEDCIELNYLREQPGWSPLNSWNDRSCSEEIKGICEK